MCSHQCSQAKALRRRRMPKIVIVEDTTRQLLLLIKHMSADYLLLSSHTLQITSLIKLVGLFTLNYHQLMTDLLTDWLTICHCCETREVNIVRHLLNCVLKGFYSKSEFCFFKKQQKFAPKPFPSWSPSFFARGTVFFLCLLFYHNFNLLVALRSTAHCWKVLQSADRSIHRSAVFSPVLSSHCCCCVSNWTFKALLLHP